MAREKYQTLTEQMFYTLLCLSSECCGADIMARVTAMTEGRVVLGPGTLYALLDNFQAEGFIAQTKVEGRRRSYALTPVGRQMLGAERERLQKQLSDFDGFYQEERHAEREKNPSFKLVPAQ
ncbi:MAG: PadR family transcriptional regulator [Clostridiales bacterium]|nr:PadR family transcriptional regulator [Clostridiales bacterium]